MKWAFWAEKRELALWNFKSKKQKNAILISDEIRDAQNRLLTFNLLFKNMDGMGRNAAAGREE